MVSILLYYGNDADMNRDAGVWKFIRRIELILIKTRMCKTIELPYL